MVVVAADQILDHVVGEQAHLHRTGDLDRASTAADDRLELFAAQQRADAAAAGVAEAGDHAAHGHEIFARGTDGYDVELRAVLLGEGRVYLKRALAPDVGGVLEADFFVLNLQVDGLVALSLEDDRVIACVFEGVGEVAAHVRIDDGAALAEAGEERDVHASGAGHTGGRQRADGEYRLCGGAERVAVKRHLVPDDLVAKTHAADIGLILGQGVLRGDRAGGQVHAQHAARPAVDAILHRHSLFPPSIQIACAAEDTSSHGMRDSAPEGQPSMHAPHITHLDDFCVAGLTVGMCHGQAAVHAPQPMH